jgi:hypothetical protein
MGGFAVRIADDAVIAILNGGWNWNCDLLVGGIVFGI